MNRLLAKFNKLNFLNEQIQQLQSEAMILTNDIMDIIESQVLTVTHNNADGCHRMYSRLMSYNNKKAVMEMIRKMLSET
jgi:hypothetical protein